MNEHHHIAIIGAGAAGLAAAIAAGEALRAQARDARVVLLDGARSLGAKILVAGGGRCNVTHDVITPADFNGSRNIVRNILAALDQPATVRWFESMGARLKREETGKLFPVTDSARTVLEALLNRCRELNVEIRTEHRVSEIAPLPQGFAVRCEDAVVRGAERTAAEAVRSTDTAAGAARSTDIAAGAARSTDIAAGAARSTDIAAGAARSTDIAAGAARSTDIAAGAARSTDIAAGAARSTDIAAGAARSTDIAAGAARSTEIHADRLILATGGRSLPRSGSDGFGWELARRLGHTVTPTYPALVPLVLDGRFFHAQLSGLSCDVELSTFAHGKRSDRRTGSLLWTHFGISGPVVLDASRHWVIAKAEDRRPEMTCSLLPGESAEHVEQWLIETSREEPRKSIETILAQRLPQRLAAAILRHVNIALDRPMAQLSRTERKALVAGLTRLTLPVIGNRGWNYAEVTAGGVPLNEIDYRTMASRKSPGAYLIGEMLDCDGRIGGFNFQWAWCTGHIAGRAAAR